MKKRYLALPILFAIPVCALWGQTERARLSGTIKDSSNAVVQGARVSAVNSQTGIRTQTTSNDVGAYILPFLTPGTYDLLVQKEGFQPFSQAGLRLDISDVARIDVILHVGGVTSTVEVTADAPLLQSGSSTMDQLMPARLLTELPLASRQTLDLIRSSGGLVYMGLNANNKAVFSMAGGRVLNQMFWMDGGNIQNTRIGVGQNEYDPPAEFLQEFRVLQSTYTAEYGATASGVIVTTTKSGTNAFHGSAFEFFRNDKLDAAGPTAPRDAAGNKVKAPLRYNLFGGTLGGPVIRNRTHFYFAYQRTQTTNGSTQLLTVPTALQRKGDFSQTFNAAGALIRVYDPFSTRVVNGVSVRDPFAGNVVPSSRLDPVALAMVDYWPQPNKPPVNLAGAQNFSGNVAQFSPWDDILGRIDHAFSSANRFYFRYVFGSRGFNNSSIFPDPVADPNNLYITRRPEYHVIFSDTHTFTPSLVLDLRYAGSNRTNEVHGAGYGSQVVKKIGLKGVPEESFPDTTIAGIQAIGNSRNTFNYPVPQHQVVGSLTVVRGNHFFKFGGEVRTQKSGMLNVSNSSGAYAFTTTGSGLPGSAQTGYGFASFLMGWGNSFSIASRTQLERSSAYLAAFAQDDWKINRDLTLNIGVRWETDTAFRDNNNMMNGFDPAAINPVSGTPGVVRFAGVNGWPRLPYETNMKNLGPRFGFAWTPFGSKKWVLRAGYGIYFEHPFDGDVTNTATLGFVSSSSLSSPDSGITPAFTLRNGINIPATSTALDDAFGAVRVGSAATTAVAFFEPNRHTGYAQHVNFGVQRQLGGNTLVEVTYMGTLSRHMPIANITMNQVPPDRMGPGNAQSRRPFPQFSAVNILFPTMGVSNYHAGMIRVEKRMSSGLTVLTSYTWSRNIGNLSENSGAGDNQNYQDYYNRRLDKGPSTVDVPHRFTWSSVYDLPFGKSRRWLTKGFLGPVLGGWTVGVVGSAQSGGPFTVTMQTDTTNAFPAGALRANIAGKPALASEARTLTRWFDTGAFQAPAAYTFGNAGRGILRGPGSLLLDSSIHKNFGWREKWNLQVRGDFLNFFNHSNLGVPGHAMGGAGFGVTTPAGSRVVQLGLRLTF